MQRRDLRRRVHGSKIVSLAEAFYGTMMGIDSDVLRTDIEIGGIDQLINFQQGREVQRNRGQEFEDVIMTPIFEGTSGGDLKMSKSLNNFIPLRAGPSENYGKMRSIPDVLIEKYIRAFALVQQSELEQIREDISSDLLEIKKQLATYMAALSMSSLETGMEERDNFERRFARKMLSKGDLATLSVCSNDLIDAIIATGDYNSRQDIRRLAQQGAIKIDGQKVDEETLFKAMPKLSSIVTVEKRLACRIFSSETAE